MTRVSVDFNTETSEPTGLLKIYEPNAVLHDGEVVTAYDDELEVQAQVTYAPQPGIWFALPDWTTKRDIIQEHAS